MDLIFLLIVTALIALDVYPVVALLLFAAALALTLRAMWREVRKPRLNTLTEQEYAAASLTAATTRCAELRKLKRAGRLSRDQDFRLALLEVELNGAPPPLRRRRDAIAA